MSQSMVAKHSMWPRQKDIIFNLSERAQRAEKSIGKDNVINATIGALMDDYGTLITMDTVYNEYKSLDNKDISAYASLEGQPDYLEAVKKVCFKEYMPDGYIKAVASPGGSGAIKLATWNYTEEGDQILTSDWFWSPYVSITEETGRKVSTYQLFDENNNFNFNSFKKEFLNIASKQERIFTILNTPAHNPTGYSVSDDEWDKIIGLSKEVATNQDKKIILFVDIAYIDFASDDNASRKFFKKFSNLPENILVIVGFSMSKGFTAYGMRMGAAICITASENVAEEFYYGCVHSCRANWSNCNRGAMKLLSNIVQDEEKFEKYTQEKTLYKEMLKRRAKVFVEEAEKVGLDILPYRDGFFVSIPCDNPREVCEELTKDNLYLVPLKAGLRFAVCAVNENKCKVSPSIIKNALQYIKNQKVVEKN
ncbi:aminotransferase class I/II-fold pyridoxal phosphate-dependent enzyme [Romboutsia sedimentorum]|uniref:Aminotransferase class I/II-fold pyridoxal phosphate-dependent enzyme n=1 Tax=Romboutsia sedimentorum TaxID=1368474 RepID=A0ABT7E734_9FIRM|nr:aminotransferase class I/II-fold pyridoxal phosphate-dependent enzyme [Romboutsia sedimentorum]MDK2562738.1 aminotransferase class I/II-fold pyridoxal phosphate-dependent enzyme [Romboutsia sedimentorum]